MLIILSFLSLSRLEEIYCGELVRLPSIKENIAEHARRSNIHLLAMVASGNN